ncbi:MAG: UDP-N-acetylglucosamine 2-epimerase [Methanosarcinaceae archaeon]|nr:UDP-N-acetylglucosamine 2-epimerase [Methanosarcinaceae archaeon]
MSKKKTLVILSSSSHINRIKPYLDSSNYQNLVVVALTFDVQLKLKTEGIDFRTPKEYITENEYKKVDEDAWYSLIQWGDSEIFGRPLKKILTYNELNLWNLVQYELYDFFIKYILKDTYTIERIIACEDPNTIVAVDYGHQGKIVSSICEIKKIPLDLISVSFIDEMREYFTILASMDRNKIHSMPKLLKYLFRIREWQRRRSIKSDIIPINEINSQEKILVIAHTKNHAPVVKPIYEILKKNNTCDVNVICLDSIVNNDAIKEFEAKKIPCTVFESYITKDIDVKVEKFKNYLVKTFSDIEIDTDFQKSFVYVGIPMWPIVKDVFLYFFISRQRLADIAKYIETLNLIYKSEKANLVVALNVVVPFGKTAVCVGNALNIPTLYVEHGLVSEHPFSGDMPATKIAASGDYTKNVLLKYGEDPTKIILTGQPKYDLLYDKKLNFNDNIYRQLSIKRDLDVIVLTTQPHPIENMMKLYRCVIGTMKNMTDKQLVIKLHPAEVLSTRKKIIDKICTEFNVENVKITKEANLYEILNISNVILTEFSTTALEAMILDKPVITINLTGESDRMPYAKSGAAIGVYDEQELLPAIESVLYDKNVRKELSKNREKFVYEQTYKQDGNASMRVVKLINQMLENPNSNYSH